MAWVEFKDRHREALHLPVRCKLNYYHYAASKIHGAVLASMGRLFGRALHDGVRGGSGKISRLERHDD